MFTSFSSVFTTSAKYISANTLAKISTIISLADYKHLLLLFGLVQTKALNSMRCHNCFFISIWLYNFFYFHSYIDYIYFHLNTILLCLFLRRFNRNSFSMCNKQELHFFFRFFYMIPMITISHIAMTSSSFLILSASFERYCVTVMPHRMKCLNRYRGQIATAAIILGIVTKSTLAFEFNVSLANNSFLSIAQRFLSIIIVFLNYT